MSEVIGTWILVFVPAAVFSRTVAKDGLAAGVGPNLVDCVEALKALHPSMLVEREIGYIGTGSEIHESAADLSTALSTPEQAQQFVKTTGVDILAPAVGNMQGMLGQGGIEDVSPIRASSEPQRSS
jgi:fructose/tagatose bisphosphate aldolase